MSTPRFAPATEHKLEAAADVLREATDTNQMSAASLYVRQGNREFARSFGMASSVDDVFLLASISKPITAATVLSLCDEEKVSLDEKVRTFIADFDGDARAEITVGQLLTHVSGLPDHVPQNLKLRARQAPLDEFVRAAICTPLLFKPGTHYSYSSMAVLLAAELSQRISGTPFPVLVRERIYEPLGMKCSAMGLGTLKLDATMRCQVVDAALESGVGLAGTETWDWNSRYWRNLAAPWGGAHGSARDVGLFLEEFLRPTGRTLNPKTARMMVRNHNEQGVRPHGLGFRIGTRAGGHACSARTFGHSGSTGTLCWADPLLDTLCVVLTTLPARAANPHPRNIVSDRVAEAVA